jgi:hypothetical protein
MICRNGLREHLQGYAWDIQKMIKQRFSVDFPWSPCPVHLHMLLVDELTQERLAEEQFQFVPWWGARGQQKDLQVLAQVAPGFD